MKRDLRLHGLSSDHHHALVLARRVAAACDAGTAGPALASEVAARFAAELAPHFAVEEELLLPALGASGAPGAAALVERTLADHAALHAHVAAARLADFAALLTEHVRFEERDLFPAAESALPASVLDAIAERSGRGRA